MDLGYVLRRAWEITWRHKSLWLFGFLVSLGTVTTRLGTNVRRWEQPVEGLPPEVERAVAGFSESPYFALAVVILLLLVLVVGVGLALLSALGRAALVDQVRVAEDRGVVNLRAGWQAGQRRLWPVFVVRLLLGLPMAVVTLIGALPLAGASLLVAVQERPEAAIPGLFAVPLTIFACLLPAICLAALLSIPLNLLRRLAVRACVLEGLDVRQSFLRAWTMLRTHLGRLTLVWLVLLGVGVGVMIVVGLPLALMAMALLSGVLMTVLVSPLLFTALALLVGLLAWLIGAAVNGVAETFLSAAWTLAYREWTGLGLTGEESTPTA